MPREANIAAQERPTEKVNAGVPSTPLCSRAEHAGDRDATPGQEPGRGASRPSSTRREPHFPTHIEPAEIVADLGQVCIAYTLTGAHEGGFPLQSSTAVSGPSFPSMQAISWW